MLVRALLFHRVHHMGWPIRNNAGPAHAFPFSASGLQPEESIIPTSTIYSQ